MNRLVTISTNITRNAIPVEMLEQQGQVNHNAVESLKDTLDLIDKPFAMISLLSGLEIRQ